MRACLLALLACGCAGVKPAPPPVQEARPSGYAVIGYVRSLRIGSAPRLRALRAVYLVGYTQEEFEAHAVGSPLYKRAVYPHDFEGMTRDSEILIRIRAGERCSADMTRTICIYMLEYGWTWLEEGT